MTTTTGWRSRRWQLAAADTSYTASTLVTVYVNGQLVWGTEPG